MKVLKALKKREKAAYPSFMRQMQQIEKWSDLQDYCESDYVRVHLLGDEGYIVLTEDEVVDWVGGKGSIFKAFSIIKKAFGDRSFQVDLREKTSLPIIKIMEQRGKINIQNLSSWEWEEEKMIEAMITIK